MTRSVAVLGAFDDLKAKDVRFLEEASKMGAVTAFVLSDEAIQQRLGRAPKFPLTERVYMLQGLRFVDSVSGLKALSDPEGMPRPDSFPATCWVDTANSLNPVRDRWCREHGLIYQVIPETQLGGFPESSDLPEPCARKRVVVTGCYDWFHSGHVRFFEEVSSYGDLYVVVGHDANIRLLKGPGHPLLSQEERRYMVGAVRFVKQALISSGEGWLDADPEIEKIKPDIYAVNEDGDRGGKREYCAERGIQYLVLKRTPAPGLPSRSSTLLRGF